MKLISIEEQIIKETINALLATGFEISMFDGEVTTVFRDTHMENIFAAMRTTDEDYLFVYQRNAESYEAGGHYGWVRFIYGNDDTEVINDYTVNLDPVMDKITAMIREYEERHG